MQWQSSIQEHIQESKKWHFLLRYFEKSQITAHVFTMMLNHCNISLICWKAGQDSGCINWHALFEGQFGKILYSPARNWASINRPKVYLRMYNNDRSKIKLTKT